MKEKNEDKYKTEENRHWAIIMKLKQVGYDISDREDFIIRNVFHWLNMEDDGSLDMAEGQVKKPSNLEFCGLKLRRYSCDDGTLYVGTRDFRPSGNKQLWQVVAKKDNDGDLVGAVRVNGKAVVRVSETTLSRNKLERFLVGGLHAVLKRKEYENRKGRELKKAKKAAAKLAHGCASTKEAEK